VDNISKNKINDCIGMEKREKNTTRKNAEPMYTPVSPASSTSHITLSHVGTPSSSSGGINQASPAITRTALNSPTKLGESASVLFNVTQSYTTTTKAKLDFDPNIEQENNKGDHLSVGLANVMTQEDIGSNTKFHESTTNPTNQKSESSANSTNGKQKFDKTSSLGPKSNRFSGDKPSNEGDEEERDKKVELPHFFETENALKEHASAPHDNDGGLSIEKGETEVVAVKKDDDLFKGKTELLSSLKRKQSEEKSPTKKQKKRKHSPSGTSSKSSPNKKQKVSSSQSLENSQKKLFLDDHKVEEGEKQEELEKVEDKEEDNGGKLKKKPN
jgi:hypothetical protein